MVTSIYGYAIGQYAPGEFLLLDALPTAHHQNLAHGLAVQALRAAGADQGGAGNKHGRVGPAGPQGGAAAEAMDSLINRLFADPVLLGSYPDLYHQHLPPGFADDLATIAAPIDFYGVNYYETQLAASPSPGNPLPFDLVPV